MAKRQAFQVRNQWPTGFEAVLKLKPKEAINDGWTFIMWSDDHSGLGYTHAFIHGPYVRINRQSLRRDNPAGFPTIPYFNDELT